MSEVFSTEEEALKQYNRLRRDTGLPLLPDEEAEEFFVESKESFPSDTAKMITNTRVLVLQGLAANSALLGKYTQNKSQEDLSKIYDNLKDWIVYWNDKVLTIQDAVDIDTTLPFFFGLASGNRGY